MANVSNGKSATRTRRILWSTGQICKLVGVHGDKTVARWIDEGLLKGVRLPGTTERRVHRDELRRFLAHHEYEWALKEMDELEGVDAALAHAGNGAGNGRAKKKAR